MLSFCLESRFPPLLPMVRLPSNVSGSHIPWEAFPDLFILPSRSQLANAAHVGSQAPYPSGSTMVSPSVHVVPERMRTEQMGLESCFRDDFNFLVLFLFFYSLCVELLNRAR